MVGSYRPPWTTSSSNDGLTARATELDHTQAHDPDMPCAQGSYASPPHGAQSPAPSIMDWTPTPSYQNNSVASNPNAPGHPDLSNLFSFKQTLAMISHAVANAQGTHPDPAQNIPASPSHDPSANGLEQRKANLNVVKAWTKSAFQQTITPKDTSAKFLKRKSRSNSPSVPKPGIKKGRPRNRRRPPMDPWKPYEDMQKSKRQGIAASTSPQATAASKSTMAQWTQTMREFAWSQEREALTWPQYTAAPTLSQATATPYQPKSTPPDYRGRGSPTDMKTCCAQPRFHINAHGRVVLDPQSTKRKVGPFRLSTPERAPQVPGCFPESPLKKRSFDDLMEDDERCDQNVFDYERAEMGLGGQADKSATGRKNFFVSLGKLTSGIRIAYAWISGWGGARVHPQEWESLGLVSRSHKRRILIPGAFPESPERASIAPTVEQTESAFGNIPPARTPSPPPSPKNAIVAPVVEQTTSASENLLPAPLPSPPLPASPAQPKTPSPRTTKPAVGAGMWKPRAFVPVSPLPKRPADSDTPEERGRKKLRTVERSDSLADEMAALRRRIKKACPALHASPRRGSAPGGVAKKASRIAMPSVLPFGQYDESESRPTSSGSDSSVSLGATERDHRAATPTAAVDPKVGPQELELSELFQTAKVAAEEERRRQEQENREEEEKKAEEERKLREEAEEQQRQAARAAARAAKLSTMTEEERDVLARSRDLFRVLSRVSLSELQQKVQAPDATKIDGNLKSLDLRTMTCEVPWSSNPRRPWLNDEVVRKATEMLCQRANEKLGWVKKKNEVTAAPFHAYTPMWYSSITGFGESSMANWGKKTGHLGEGLLSTRAVFLPVCDGSHWRLVVVSGKNRTIQYFDSLGGSGERYIHTAKRLLRVFMGEYWNDSDWTVINEQMSPRQCNGSDCGMFTILNTAAILRGRKVAPDSYDSAVPTIDYARNWFAAALVNRGFTGAFDWEDDDDLAMA